MHIKYCKLSKNKQLALMQHFITGVTAKTAADLVGIHRHSEVRFFHKLREKIALKQQDRSEQLWSQISLLSQKHNHINGIENFWNQTKRHMRKFNEMPRQNFNLFLKKCEWRLDIGTPRKPLVGLKSLLKEGC